MKVFSILSIINIVAVLFAKYATSEKFCETKMNGDAVCLEAEAEVACEDEREECSHWARSGECKANPSYMLDHCKKSCNNCPTGNYNQKIYGVMNDKRIGEGPCEDNHEDCQSWESEGKCATNAVFMLVECRRSCSMCPGQTHSRPSIMPPQPSN